jgi:uncharacterized protein YjbI with pentapeptide repeats
MRSTLLASLVVLHCTAIWQPAYGRPTRQAIEAYVNEQRAAGKPIDVVGRFGTELVELDLTGLNLQKANLQRVDLMSTKLHRADLRDADLREAHLYLADFQGADLRGANLQDAELDRTNLSQTDLRGAHGVGSKRAATTTIDLTGANLAGTDLRAADLGRAELDNADLSGADLRGAVLAMARMSGTKLDGANVKDVLMINVRGIENRVGLLSEMGALASLADLERAVRDDLDLGKSNLEGANLAGGNLAGARLEEAWLHSANLHGTNLKGAKLKSAFLRYSDLAGAAFENADLRETDAWLVKGPNVRLAGADLRQALWASSVLTGADLSGADLRGADLSRSDLTGANLRDALLDDVNVSGAIIRDLKALEPEREAALQRQAQRWKVDLAEGYASLRRGLFCPLYLVTLAVLCYAAVRAFKQFRSRGVFVSLSVANGMNLAPLPVMMLVILMGGAPVVQMSRPGGWHFWFSMWPLLLGANGIALVLALAGSLYHLVVNGLFRPQPQFGLFALYVLPTLLLCPLTFQLLLDWAPDA